MSLAELKTLLSRADPAAGRPADEAADAAARALDLAVSQNRFEPDGACAAAWLCAQQLRQGRYAQVVETARRWLPWLDRTGLLEPRCETLRVAAVAACEAGDLPAAFDLAQQLGTVAADAGHAGWQLMAAYALGACLDRIGDPWQATRVMRDALIRHGDRATPRQRLIAAIGQCAFSGDALIRLRDVAPPAEREALAAQTLEAARAAVALLTPDTEPVFVVAARGNLGEALMLAGQPDAAQALLQEAVDLAREQSLPMYRLRAEASLALWLARSGRHEQAVALAERALAELPDPPPPALALRLHDAAQQAAAAMARHDLAYRHLIEFERVERRRTLAELRAQSTLFVTRAEAQVSQHIADLARAEAARSRNAAERDPLTGLGNRAHLQRELAERQEAGALLPAVLALIDVDHFKAINDQHGHAAGDAVLVALAQLLQQGLRGGDVIARLGGEEFAVALPCTPVDVALEVCERVRHSVATRSQWPELPPGQRLTVSIGLAPHTQGDSEASLRRADRAMYAVKRAGRNAVRLDPEAPPLQGS